MITDLEMLPQASRISISRYESRIPAGQGFRVASFWTDGQSMHLLLEYQWTGLLSLTLFREGGSHGFSETFEASHDRCETRTP